MTSRSHKERARKTNEKKKNTNEKTKTTKEGKGTAQYPNKTRYLSIENESTGTRQTPFHFMQLLDDNNKGLQDGELRAGEMPEGLQDGCQTKTEKPIAAALVGARKTKKEIHLSPLRHRTTCIYIYILKTNFFLSFLLFLYFQLLEKGLNNEV